MTITNFMDQKLQDDYKLIKDRHEKLVSAGRAGGSCSEDPIMRANEHRVGVNRAVDVVEQEAEDFLRELYQNNFFSCEVDFQERLKSVQLEVRNSSVTGVICETQEIGIVGGAWSQTQRELEFGIRRAWRNARKWIMRSHCEDLKLCDLRSVKRSNEMAMELVKGLTQAYNSGNIVPTVFVFPPRTANNRGAMIWNDQILSFAGYQAEDGTIIGDPKNIQLTKDIIELGWVPPQPKSRWDVLPVVVMAEDDEPVFVELPTNLRKLVEISHPRYKDAFQKLDLKWVAFPALSNLGFDIGGVQYTATPFIGWFMDTEIGIRDLANPLRYNVLPDLITTLYLNDKTSEYTNSPKNLATYELLAMLSRAQIELNYAIYYSFLREGITMSNSLSASKKWAQYDHEFEKENGFSLSSNSNAQPIICWHVQDPIDAWRTEKLNQGRTSMTQTLSVQTTTKLLNSEREDGDAIQDKSVLTAASAVKESSTSIPEVEGPSSDVIPALKIPSSTNAPSDDAKPHTKPTLPTTKSPPSLGVRSYSLETGWGPLQTISPPDDAPASLRVRSYSLTSGWGPLIDLATMPVSSPFINTDQPPTSADVVKSSTFLCSSTLTRRWVYGQPSNSEFITALAKTFPASEYLIRYSRGYDPTLILKVVWPVVCIPTVLVLALCLKVI
ncbi:nitric oxide synthase-like protein [Collybia sordida]|uniref:nitric-oxide synthase (NADPH) n=1 Tax=Collybia sordida TaxID=123925 RepID=A0A8H3U0D4_9AGAR|nr:nitric oxide synthase-like protein [Collybia sordida]